MSRTRRTGPAHRNRRTLAAVALPAAVLAATLVSGCSAGDVGAAAVVGNDRITMAHLQNQVEDYTKSLPNSPAPSGDLTSLQQTMLQRMIHHDLFVALAKKEHIEVTDSQIDAFLEQFKASQGGDLTNFLAQSGFTGESVRTAAYDELVRQQLTAKLGGDQAVAEAVKKMGEQLGVSVNPRYGKWDGLQIKAESGSLSQAAKG